MVGPPSAQTTLKRTSIHVLDSRKRARIASDDTGYGLTVCTQYGNANNVGIVGIVHKTLHSPTPPQGTPNTDPHITRLHGGTGHPKRPPAQPNPHVPGAPLSILGTFATG